MLLYNGFDCNIFGYEQVQLSQWGTIRTFVKNLTFMKWAENPIISQRTSPGCEGFLFWVKIVNPSRFMTIQSLINCDRNINAHSSSFFSIKLGFFKLSYWRQIFNHRNWSRFYSSYITEPNQTYSKEGSELILHPLFMVKSAYNKKIWNMEICAYFAPLKSEITKNSAIF